MGAMKEWLRTDSRVGSVDLSILALPETDYSRPETISFLSKRGVWYNLKPLAETALAEDGTIFPVQLERSNRSGPYENILDASINIIPEIMKWAVEGRHFPHIGSVAVQNQLVTEGDTLDINGRQTGPLDIAWVTERIDPSTGETGGAGRGTYRADGSVEIVWTRTVANF